MSTMSTYTRYICLSEWNRILKFQNFPNKTHPSVEVLSLFCVGTFYMDDKYTKTIWYCICVYNFLPLKWAKSFKSGRHCLWHSLSYNLPFKYIGKLFLHFVYWCWSLENNRVDYLHKAIGMFYGTFFAF